VEAYVDDVVIKTENSENFIKDLQLVFNSLRRYRWKLNPEKCVFGVPAGKLLGFIVSHRGIEANPEKIEAIMRMEAPRSQKKVQRLIRCMAALSRFISRLGEKGLPFYKLLKKVDKCNALNLGVEFFLLFSHQIWALLSFLFRIRSFFPISNRYSDKCPCHV
jgi:hypothetical protein